MATTSKKTSGSIKTGFSGFGSNVVKSNKANNAKQASTPAFSGAVSSAFKTGATKLTDKGSGGLQSKARDEAIRRSGGGGSVKKAESGTLSSSIISPTNFAAQTQSIGVSDLGSISSPISLPTPPKIADYGSTIQSNNIALGADQTGLFKPQEVTAPDVGQPQPTTGITAGDSILQRFGIAPPPEKESKADAYLKAQKDFQIKKKQDAVSKLQTTLNAIVAQSQANQLAVTGQGRGIPEVIIGGQQAQIAKEAAISALPIQAQLSAAQGDLEMAQENLRLYSEIVSQDIDDRFNYQMKLYDIAYDLATKDQQNLIEDKRAETAFKRQKELAQFNFNLDRQLKMIGASQGGQSALSSPQQTAVDNLNSVLTSLDDYKRLYESKVGRTGANLFGKDSGELSGAYNALIFQIAQAAGTGALQAADREVVEAMIPNPTTLSGALGGFRKGGKSGGLGSITEARKIFVNKKNAIEGTSSTTPQTTTPEDLRAKYGY
jgi:hypothetical protein